MKRRLRAKMRRKVEKKKANRLMKLMGMRVKQSKAR
jgi:hypothetical protein